MSHGSTAIPSVLGSAVGVGCRIFAPRFSRSSSLRYGYDHRLTASEALLERSGDGQTGDRQYEQYGK